MPNAAKATRVFKTSWFTKKARKARISDEELCRAIREVMKGQANDLGGGVFKKRLNKNQHRGIVLAKSGRLWVFVYFFAKKDRDNIEDDELKAFRELADIYAEKTDEAVALESDAEELVEICREQEVEIQE